MSDVREALCKHLQDDAGGVMSIATDVYPKVAPKGAAHPLVIVRAYQAPRANFTFQGVAFEDSVYLALSVDEGTSPARAVALNKAVKERLDDAEIVVEGYELLVLRWIGDLEYADKDDTGNDLQFEGSLFEVMVEQQ